MARTPGGHYDIVVNAREFQRGLRKVDNEVAKGTRREMTALSRKMRDKMRAKVPRGPAEGGHAYRAYTSGARGLIPTVSFNRAYRAYAPWLDFGGQLPSKASGRQARIVRPRVSGGRYFYPTIAESRDEAVETIFAVLENARRKAGL